MLPRPPRFYHLSVAAPFEAPFETIGSLATASTILHTTPPQNQPYPPKVSMPWWHFARYRAHGQRRRRKHSPRFVRYALDFVGVKGGIEGMYWSAPKVP